MHKFKVGDSVRVVNKIPKWGGDTGIETSLWSYRNHWVSDMDYYLGKEYKITSVHGYGYVIGEWHFPESSLELAEMNLDLWSKMSPEKKFNYNVLALKALANGVEIEEFWGGKWLDTEVIRMNFPCRPKAKEVMPDTVIKWTLLKDKKPHHNRRCYIINTFSWENSLVRLATYNGYGAFKLEDGQIVTSKWWSPC